MVNRGMMKGAARKQGRSRTMEALGCARECGHYCLVGKEEPLRDRKMTTLVLGFRTTAISKRSLGRLEIGNHYNSPGEGRQSLEPGKKQ